MSVSINIPMFSGFGKIESNKKIKKCKGGAIPGITKCENEEYIDGLCETHYEEFKAEQERKEAEKRAQIERKMKAEAEAKERNNKYNGNEQIFAIVDKEGDVIGYECKTEVNDKLAAAIFRFLHTENGVSLIQRDGENICVFDKQTGLWTTDDKSVKKAIGRSNLRLYHISYDEEKECWIRAKKCSDFSGIVSNIEKVLKYLKFDLEDTRFIESNVETNIGKLLFADGIYDFKTNTFTEGFDPKIVFFHRMERKFPKVRDNDKINWVNKHLFTELFKNKEEADYLRGSIARAIYGDYQARKAYLCRGETSSGKGMITEALTKTFKGLVSEFNADNLIYSKSTKDEAQKMMWLIPFKTSRLIISNEITIETAENGKIKTFIDSNKVKRIVSGGDAIQVRGMNQDIYEMVNRATMFFMANDFPEFMPKDSAIKDRIENMYFQYSFIENPDEKLTYQKKRDITIKAKFRDAEYQDAVFWAIADAYQELVINKPITKAPVKENVEIDWDNDNTFESVFNEFFEIGTDEDRIPVNEFCQYFISRLGITDRKVGIELAKFGLKNNITFESKVSNGKRYRHSIIKKKIDVI